MTAPLRSTPRLSAIPASQNTAPVAEFRCLFTLDLRRKQKRWQDGYLKFHTFNSRVMVYDATRNFLGDTYWKESSELHEGNELTLDKGIMVEVAEALGVTQTDLTPLFEKKSPQAKPTPARPLPRPSVPLASLPRVGSQLRHKSLNTLLGTPKGPIGKSVPIKSPFEARREKENECAEERAAKRQKTVHMAGSVKPSGPIAVETPTVIKDLPLWTRTSEAKKTAAAPKSIPRGAVVVDLDSTPDRISSDVTLPSSPRAMQMSKPQPSVTSAPVQKPDPPKAPPLQPPKLPRTKVLLPRAKAKETPQRPPRSSSPPVSASNRISNINFALEPVRKPPKEPSPPQSPLRDPRAKSLRLSSGPRRGMLLRQTLPPPRPPEPPKPPAKKPKRKEKEKARENNAPEESIFEPVPWLSDDENPSKREKLVETAEVSIITKKRKVKPTAKGNGSARKPKTSEPSPPTSPDAFDDMEVIHGLMDQQMMPKWASKRREPTKSEFPPARQTTKARAAALKKSLEKPQPIREPSPPPDLSPNAKKPKLAATETAVDEVHIIHNTSPPPSPIVIPDSLPVLRAPSETPSLPSRPSTSRSASPRKPALSTGGFRKKPKKPPAATTLSTTTAAKPQQSINLDLPPHPLTANKRGPLLNAAEISAHLEKPAKRTRIQDDPIEDGSQFGEDGQRGKGKSKALRRVRSANDADPPIPSTSDDWERRNLAPDPAAPTANAVSATNKPKPKGGLAALVRKTDPRKKFQRAQSLNAETTMDGDVEIAELPVDTDVGPWSTEAFDLFEWRPPGKEGQDDGAG